MRRSLPRALPAGPRRALALLFATALLAVLPLANARADSLVYIKGGEVWISHGDGSDARQVTGAPDNWSWPSEDDSGVIVAAGGAGGIAAGQEDTPGSEVYRLDQHGASLSAPQQTPGSVSTPGCVSYPPEGLRVAPDGRHFVYDAFVCDRFYSLIGTVGGEGFSGSEYLSEFRFPFWVDNSDFVASRGGMPLVDSEGEWWTHPLGEAANRGYNWFGDPETYAEPGNPDGWATGFDGIAVSPDGTKVATVEEDASNWTDGAARRVALRLWSAGGAPTPAHPSVPTPTFKCELALPADPGTTAWFANAGPSFSPDGARLAFAEPDGVHVADVSNLNDCAAVTAPLVIPGATQPFWSAGEEAADAGYVPPSGGGGGSGVGGSQNRPSPPGRDTKPPTIGALTMHPRRFAVAGKPTTRTARARLGSTVHYTLSESARVTFTVELSSRGRRRGGHCVKATTRLRRAPACALERTVGRLTQDGVKGTNELAFSGRLGGRKLAPGRYRLEVTATDASGNRSTVEAVPFTIVKALTPPLSARG